MATQYIRNDCHQWKWTEKGKRIRTGGPPPHFANSWIRLWSLITLVSIELCRFDGSITACSKMLAMHVTERM